MRQKERKREGDGPTDRKRQTDRETASNRDEKNRNSKKITFCISLFLNNVKLRFQIAIHM